MKRIGILGDGQLALMLGEAAFARNLSFTAYSAEAAFDRSSSFAAKFPNHYKSIKELIKELNKIKTSENTRNSTLQESDSDEVFTLENEFFSTAELVEFENRLNLKVIPDSNSYSYFQDKISQRKFYESLLIPSPQWMELKLSQKLSHVLERFQFPFVMKAAQGGYDGYGVKIIHNDKEFEETLIQFRGSQNKPILIEEKVDLLREYAQGVLLDGKGEALYLPLMETVQRNGTCVLVFSRSTLPENQANEIKIEIKNCLKKIASSSLKGLFNFEFFVSKAGKISINEGAPRPHNSQHLTIDACDQSQFDLLVSYLETGKVVSGEMVAKPGVMINLLGQSTGPHYQLTLPENPSNIKVIPKMYLKKECRPGRKMGHVNAIIDSPKMKEIDSEKEMLNELVSIGEKILKEYRL